METGPLLETYWCGYVGDTDTPHFWIRTPRSYFDTYLSALVQSNPNQNWVSDYLGHDSTFALRDGRFGFGRVGTIAEAGTETVLLRVHLRDRSYTQRTLLTLRLLLDRLNNSRRERDVWVQTERQQVMEFNITTSHTQKGHCLEGEIFPQAVRELTDGNLDTLRANTNAALQQTWGRIAPREYARYSEECGVQFHADGRPELTCFGHGICSGVLPGHGETSWRISSDNVDVAYQELVLLAGWFSLAQTLRT